MRLDAKLEKLRHDDSEREALKLRAARQPVTLCLIAA
jgi:hypothetical protein